MLRFCGHSYCLYLHLLFDPYPPGMGINSIYDGWPVCQVMESMGVYELLVGKRAVKVCMDYRHHHLVSHHRHMVVEAASQRLGGCRHDEREEGDDDGNPYSRS